MKKKIAVTGGIGSGKSIALSYIKGLGFPVFSCDLIYKKIIQQKEYVEKVGEFFPEAIINNQIDRKKLSTIVFQNSAKLKLLNELAHPLILKELDKEISQENKDVVFAEVPLLFENNLQDKFDKVIVVYRDISKRIEAICKRDGIPPEAAQARINNQFDYDKYMEVLKKDNRVYIFANNQTKENLYKNIDNFIAKTHQS